MIDFAPPAIKLDERKHRFGPWIWTTMLSPGTQSFAMTGWWTRCLCCPDDRKSYVMNAKMTDLDGDDARAATARVHELYSLLMLANVEGESIADLVRDAALRCHKTLCVREYVEEAA